MTEVTWCPRDPRPPPIPDIPPTFSHCGQKSRGRTLDSARMDGEGRGRRDSTPGMMGENAPAWLAPLGRLRWGLRTVLPSLNLSHTWGPAGGARSGDNSLSFLPSPVGAGSLSWNQASWVGSQWWRFLAGRPRGDLSSLVLKLSSVGWRRHKCTPHRVG